MLFSSPESISRLEAKLSVTPEQGAVMFLGPAPTSLYERERARLGVRWCPQCLTGWYHSARFQDIRLRRCPWHGCPLLNECPHCLRTIDPLGERAWTCSACHKNLASSPRDWLQEFKARERQSVAEVLDPWLAELRSADGKSTLCLEDERFTAPPTDMYSSAYWRLGFLYEDGCALWGTLAREHSDCARAEAAASMTQYSSAEFACPVAAGILQAMSQLGARSEPYGDWQRWRATPESTFGTSSPSNLPGWATAAYVRELGRLRVLDAVESLASLAETGRRRSFWKMPASQPTIDHLKAGVLLGNLATEPQLLKAFRRGAKSCPNLLATARR